MQVRVSALEAIDKYGAKARSAVPALLKCLQDQNLVIRPVAARVLGDMDPEAAAQRV